MLLELTPSFLSFIFIIHYAQLYMVSTLKYMLALWKFTINWQKIKRYTLIYRGTNCCLCWGLLLWGEHTIENTREKREISSIETQTEWGKTTKKRNKLKFVFKRLGKKTERVAHLYERVVSWVEKESKIKFTVFSRPLYWCWYFYSSFLHGHYFIWLSTSFTAFNSASIVFLSRLILHHTHGKTVCYHCRG